MELLVCAQFALLVNLFRLCNTAIQYIVKRDSVLKEQQVIEMKHPNLTENESIYYIQTRVTFWLLHTLLKGTTKATDFCSNREGDALIRGKIHQ